MNFKELFQKLKNMITGGVELSGEDYDEVEEDEVLKRQEDDFVGIMKSWARADKENYFVAGDERSRLIIRGKYLRTISLIKKIEKLKSLKVAVEETKLGGRYGV